MFMLPRASRFLLGFLFFSCGLFGATSAFFSLPTNLSGNQGTVVTVPVSVGHLFDGSGNQGLNSIDIILTYDPTVFTVSNSDVSQGSLLTNPPPNGTWTFAVNTATPGEIDITASSSGLAADVVTQTGGVLANINFHIKGAAPTGNSTLHVVVPPELSPNGLSSDMIPHSGPNSIQGDVAGYALNAADQVDGVVNIQNFSPVTTLSIPTGQLSAPGGTIVVPVNISNPDPNGSAGLISANAVILYDPNVLSVAASGAVAAGSVIPGTGWSVTYDGATSGGLAVLVLHLTTNSTPLTSTSAGSLWLVTFTVNPAAGSQVTALNLIPFVQIGATPFNANVTGANKTYQLTPAPTNATSDTVDGSIQIQAPATHFSVLASGPQTAGVPFSFILTARDATNAAATGYTGTVHFTKTDSKAGSSVPADYTFTAGDAGSHTFVATFTSTGNQTFTATDTGNGSITATSNNILVFAGATSHLGVSAPGTAIAGAAFNFTVTALDIFNNTTPGYTGTVQFSKSDNGAGSSVPVAYSFTLGDSGTHTFSATLTTAANQTLTASDAGNSLAGTSNSIAVSAGAATHFSVSAPGTSPAGTPLNFTVTALDVFNNTATGYLGTVHFTKSDSGAGSSVPADLAFSAGFAGVHTFSATLVTTGNQTLTATDTVSGSITGTASTQVTAAPASHFSVSAPGSATAGVPFNFTVTALDSFNNTVNGYSGTVQFTATDGAATLPANYIFTGVDQGVRNTSATMKTAGSRTITVTDSGNGSITGTSNPILVSAAAATHFSLTAPASTRSGTAFSFTVTAQDQFGNTATSYAGIAGFTSSDGAATLPLNYQFVGPDSGVHTLSATLVTGGSQTITATDTTNASITGSRGITVALPPSITKSFTPASVVLGGVSTLSFTVTNPPSNAALTGVGFTDTLPAGLIVATPNNLIGSCGGGTIGAVAGSGSVTLTGASLASGSCTFSVGVVAASPGVKANTTGNVTSAEGGPGNTASATLTVLSGGTQLGRYPAGGALITRGAAGNVTYYDGNATKRFSFGSTGSGAGQFNPPSGVATAPNGYILVTDPGNARVVVFDANLNFRYNLGGPGLANGQFENPTGIAVTSAGNVLVVDTGNNRVQVFDSNSFFKFKFGTAGTGRGQFNAPTGILILPNGNIAVSDTGNSRVEIFDAGGNFLLQFGTAGSGNGQLNQPSGLAMDTAGNLLVADTGNNRVQAFDTGGSYRYRFGTAGAGNGQFTNPTSLLTIPGSNYLWVLDDGNSRVEVFDSLSNYRFQFPLN